MNPIGENPLTVLLEAARAGDKAAADRAWAIIEPEVHRMAANQIARDGMRGVLQPTSMVSEAYLRLIGPNGGVQWANHRHFFGAVAETLRRIRVDRARTYRAAKRGGGAAAVELREDDAVAGDGVDRQIDDLALDEALTRLERENPRAAEVAKLRHYSGHTREEIAAMQGISPRTVDSEWRYARCWLFDALSG